MADIPAIKMDDESADNERAIQEALKSIRFTDLPGNETTPGAAVPSPMPKAMKPAVVPKPVTPNFAKILEETKLPERRNAPTLPTPQGQLVRTTVSETPKAPSANQNVRIVTPEGSSAPILSTPQPRVPPNPQTLSESIVGELSPSAPKPVPTQPSPAAASAMLNKPGLTPNEALPSESRPDKRPIVTSLHTLKDDLRDLVKVRKMSLIHAATLESERARQTADVESVVDATHARRRLRMFRMFSIFAILVALGGAALFAVFVVQSERSGGQTTNLGSSLIFAEQTLSFPLLYNLNPREERSQLATSRHQGNLTLGAMLRIVPTVSSAGTERPATTAEFLHAIADNPPDELMRSINPGFFFGTHTIDENVPLMIIPIASYEHAFAGMLAWEPSLNDDMTPLFSLVHYEKPDAEGVPQLVGFEDVLIKNYDVRALRDPNGDIKMLYSFPSRNFLIISESPHSFVEALARLRAERRL